jgi:hypothetical protein
MRAIAAVAAAAPVVFGSALLLASPAGASTNTVTVQANSPILSSGITIDGTHNDVTVTAAGSWQIGADSTYGYSYGPSGSTYPLTEACALVPTAPMGSLVGTLDGGTTWFALGAGPTVIAGSGDLGFAANDCTPGPFNYVYFGDNSGSVDVTVTTAARTPTTTSQCKSGGWQAYGVFKNQGDCVSFVATGGRNTPAQ